MIGMIAGCLTTTAFLPQVVKVLKTKNTSSISLGMYLMQVTGIMMWSIHGFLVKDMAVLGANVLTLVLSAIILLCKLKYK